MAKRLTLKRKKFVKEYVESMGNGSKAVLEAYNTKPKNAPNIANQLLKEPEIQEAIEVLLNKKGITLDYLNDTLKKGIETNLQEGKPSMAVASDLIKFAYKLHNVIPANKSMNLSYSKRIIEHKSTQELQEDLAKLQQNSNRLLQDLE